MRARHEVYRFTADGLDRAQKLVDAGLSLIGENSLLLATRGMVSWYYLNFSIRPEDRYLDEAAAYAARALEQDSQNYVGIFLRGLVASKRGDIESAIRDLQAAREQKPGDAMVLNELIRHYLSAGQEHTESARPVYEASLRVDPLHPLNWAQWAWRHFTAGRLDEAVDAARRIFQLTDRGNPARVYAAYYLALANEREEAIAVFEAEGSALPDTSYGSVSLFLSRALQGDAEGAIRSRHAAIGASCVLDGVSCAVPRGWLLAHRAQRRRNSVAPNRGCARLHQLPDSLDARPVLSQPPIRSALRGVDANGQGAVASAGGAPGAVADPPVVARSVAR